MRHPKLLFITFFIFCSHYTFAQNRIVSIGGTLTEIVFELGLGEKIVGIDATSVFPEEKVKNIKNLGYRQSISMEGIVSLNPDIVLASTKLTPQPLIDSLKKLKVNLVVVKEEDTFESAKEKIKVVANKLNRAEKGKTLISKLEKELSVAKEKASNKEIKKKLVFIYARGGNRIFLSGSETAADKMIQLAGAKNAFDQVKGFKPITTEALIESNPDAVVMLKSGKDSLKNPWSSIKGIEHTTAGKNKNMILVDDLSFLGFGPRSASELIEFSKKIHNL